MNEIKVVHYVDRKPWRIKIDELKTRWDNEKYQMYFKLIKDYTDLINYTIKKYNLDLELI